MVGKHVLLNHCSPGCQCSWLLVLHYLRVCVQLHKRSGQLVCCVVLLCGAQALQTVVLDGFSCANSSCHSHVDLHTVGVGILCFVILLLLLVLLHTCRFEPDSVWLGVLVVHICSSYLVLASLWLLSFFLCAPAFAVLSC